jgi:L-methionine (R)-S-oxide reductase
MYESMLKKVQGLLGDERHPLANAANISALIFQEIEGLNWAGFYLMHGGELLLGPFQGKPACLRIALTRGVCGAAARENRTMLVDDVHAFPGHIACDEASRSELVCPIRVDGRVIGVIDLDSARPARFTMEEQRAVERVAELYAAGCDFSDAGYSLT